jgi:hypothetical protein
MSGFSGELHDVKMADDLMLGKQKLQLKGMTLREVSVLGIYIRVYVGGLYTVDKTLSCEKLLATNTPKVILMSFLRHVRTSELVENLETGVSKNCDDKCAGAKTKVGEIKNMVPSPNTGDIIKVVFSSQNVEFSLNDKVLGKVDGADFSKILLAAYIGKNPPSADFKAGLCGK